MVGLCVCVCVAMFATTFYSVLCYLLKYMYLHLCHGKGGHTKPAVRADEMNTQPITFWWQLNKVDDNIHLESYEKRSVMSNISHPHSIWMCPTQISLHLSHTLGEWMRDKSPWKEENENNPCYGGSDQKESLSEREKRKYENHINFKRNIQVRYI